MAIEDRIHMNGEKKREGKYINGKRDGLWTEWHPDGQKKTETTYINNMKENVNKWDESGNEIKN